MTVPCTYQNLMKASLDNIRPIFSDLAIQFNVSDKVFLHPSMLIEHTLFEYLKNADPNKCKEAVKSAAAFNQQFENKLSSAKNVYLVDGIGHSFILTLGEAHNSEQELSNQYLQFNSNLQNTILKLEKERCYKPEHKDLYKKIVKFIDFWDLFIERVSEEQYDQNFIKQYQKKVGIEIVAAAFYDAIISGGKNEKKPLSIISNDKKTSLLAIFTGFALAQSEALYNFPDIKKSISTPDDTEGANIRILSYNPKSNKFESVYESVKSDIGRLGQVSELLFKRSGFGWGEFIKDDELASIMAKTRHHLEGIIKEYKQISYSGKEIRIEEEGIGSSDNVIFNAGRKEYTKTSIPTPLIIDDPEKLSKEINKDIKYMNDAKKAGDHEFADYIKNKLIKDRDSITTLVNQYKEERESLDKKLKELVSGIDKTKEPEPYAATSKTAATGEKIVTLIKQYEGILFRLDGGLEIKVTEKRYYSTSKLAEEFKVTNHTINYFVRQLIAHGYLTKERATPKEYQDKKTRYFTEDEKAKIEIAVKGMNLDQLAKKVMKSPTRIKQLIKGKLEEGIDYVDLRRGEKAKFKFSPKAFEKLIS